MTKQILEHLTQTYTVLAIIKVGSQLYYDNPADLDYLCIVKEPTPKKEFLEIGNKTVDLLILNEIDYSNKINLTETLPKHCLFNYQLTFSKTVYKKDNYNLVLFDMFDKNIKIKYLDILKPHYQNTLGRAIYDPILGKFYVHYYLILKMYEQNSAELAKEIIDDIISLRKSDNNVRGLIARINNYFKSNEIE